ncbi:MAG: phosphate-starvation-inducible PsiE family protein [Sphingomonadaceae bacterium]
MIPYLDRFERIVMYVLLIVLAAVVLLATVELVWVIVKDVLTPPVFVLEIHELLDLFGLFLLVLIGIELMHSVKTYVTSRVYHLETVLSVALIAVARKIIVLEPKDLPEGALLGIAGLVLSLAVGYYVLRRSHQDDSLAAPERQA